MLSAIRDADCRQFIGVPEGEEEISCRASHPGSWTIRWRLRDGSRARPKAGRGGSTRCRNEVDAAFNALASCPYDADREWEMGAPWYRQNRVNPSGAGPNSASQRWASGGYLSTVTARGTSDRRPRRHVGYGASFRRSIRGALHATGLWKIAPALTHRRELQGQSEEFLSGQPWR